ncbi:MAG: heme transport system substrate-binding protein, partial [Subtercola sp.]|nr:heme transport system substrate-binding protein [Subtercola sp.]
MPSVPRTARARTLATALLGALLTVAVLAGCSGPGGAAVTGGDTTPRLADVTAVEDPKAWNGATTARISPVPVEPVTDGPQQLPASIVDSQGTAVTVTDTSRILALDIYGSLSRIVFDLGFGDNVIGRDVSSGFA